VKTSVVTILGLGLMGGSLAGALQGKVKSLNAVDPDLATRQLAQKSGWVDRISDDPWKILPGSDFVILAAPVSAILDLITRLPEWHPGKAVVLDLGSTKVQICQELARLPDRFDVVGGHPICGKEEGGFEHADPTIFRGETFTFSSCGILSELARNSAEWLADTVGASSLWVDPQEHDSLMSVTSHLPYLLSSALVLATPANSQPFQGPGYRSVTRLAKTPREMILDVLFSNREFVIQRMNDLQKVLKEMQEHLDHGNREAIKEICDQAAARMSQPKG
jgi:prephenate dehydrogenase